MEPIAVINKRLNDHYGRFEDGRPNWRVIWSDDEFEKRRVTETDEGFQLLTPIIKTVPKYSYAKHRHILERLVPASHEDLTEKTSYEPVWTFENSLREPLPPDWDIIYLIINRVRDMIYSAGNNAPYKAPEGMGNTPEEIKMRVEKLQEELFGNESKITDSLAMDSAVGYGTRNRHDL